MWPEIPSNTLQFFWVEMFIVCTNFMAFLIESIFFNKPYKGNTASETPWDVNAEWKHALQLSVRTFTLVNPMIEEIILSLHCLSQL